MADEPITLDLLGRQLERVLSEIGALRDDMRVLTAIVLRHENGMERYDMRLAEMLNQVRAMVSQHQRFDSRLRAVEERE